LSNASDLQAYDLGLDQTFQQRIQDALLAYAYQVEIEAGTVTNHVARAAFASKVVQNPAQYAPELAGLIAAVDTASGALYISTTPPNSVNVTDAAIGADVIIGFNLLAGI
jgi:hypothetical protein